VPTRFQEVVAEFPLKHHCAEMLILIDGIVKNQEHKRRLLYGKLAKRQGGNIKKCGSKYTSCDTRRLCIHHAALMAQ
jgi:hypothetical protein